MLRFAYVAVLVLMAVVYHYVLGWEPTTSEIYDDLEWWRPRGYVHQWLIFSPLVEMASAEEGAGRYLPVLLFSLPPIAMVAAGFALFRSALVCAAGLWLGLSICTFAYYGLLADRVWRFFGWRFTAVAFSFTAVITVCSLAPSLLRALWALPRWVAGGLLLAVFALVFLLSTEITGTDPQIAFNISPWPVVTVFGFLLFGYLLAGIHIGAGAGIYLGSRIPGDARLAVTLGVALLVGALGAYVPFTAPRVGQMVFLGILSCIYAGVAYRTTNPERLAPVSSGLSRVIAGCLLVLMIGVSNQAAIAFQIRARDQTAASLLETLEAYKEANGEYPERLQDLVPEYLSEIPRPRIGLIAHEGDSFTYSKYSMEDFSLEFASVQWVQCAYSPPFEFAAYEEDDDDKTRYGDDEYREEGTWEEFDEADVAAPSDEPTEEQLEMAEALEERGLEGAWSCPREPPRLW